MGEWGVLVAASGACLLVGIYLAILGFQRRPVRLGDLLGVLDATPVHAPDTASPQERTGWDERLGAWVYRRGGVRIGPSMRRTLELQGRTVADFAAQKVLLALGGLLVPLVYEATGLVTGHPAGTMPLAWSLALAVAGFVLPDVTLHGQGEETRSDARASLMTLFDLAILERMANQSAVASLQAAASMSDSLVFRRIRAAMDQARLEQRAPWDDVLAVARELDLPELADLVDILRLDEQGAALVDALRARVAELRDGNLARDLVEAQRVSESMTVWMVLPTMIFGLILLAPPILRLAGLA